MSRTFRFTMAEKPAERGEIPDIALAIVKGEVAEYAMTVARINNVNRSTLASILRDIALSLDSK